MKSKKKKKEEKKTGEFYKFYKKYYKFGLIIPIIMFIISTFSIFNAINDDGTPIYRGISLKGGVSAIIYVNSEKSVLELEKYLLNKFKGYEFSVSELEENNKRIGYIIDTNLNESLLKESLENYFNIKIDSDNYSSNYISPTLSNEFFKQVSKILIISFILMSIVIFLYFKEFLPSFIVVLSGFFDVYVTVGILDLIKYKISVAGMGALLMLIGYSIDTDILLTNRLIKEKSFDYFLKLYDAFKTGMTMSLTTLIASLTAYFFTTSSVIKEITFIIVLGLLVDIVSTWIQNATLLIWSLENKETNNKNK